jgi:hypothetical protein
MIPMPELEIIKDLTELIEEEYPSYLLNTEEEMPDIGHLPSLRYVGIRQTMPKTTTGPHLLIELEKAEPSVKDRIIKQTTYHLTLQLNGIPKESIYFYIVALKTLLDNDTYQIAMVEFINGIVVVEVKRRN